MSRSCSGHAATTGTACWRSTSTRETTCPLQTVTSPIATSRVGAARTTTRFARIRAISSWAIAPGPFRPARTGRTSSPAISRRAPPIGRIASKAQIFFLAAALEHLRHRSLSGERHDEVLRRRALQPTQRERRRRWQLRHVPGARHESFLREPDRRSGAGHRPLQLPG